MKHKRSGVSKNQKGGERGVKKIIELAGNMFCVFGDAISNLSEGQEVIITIVVSILASVGTVLVATR